MALILAINAVAAAVVFVAIITAVTANTTPVATTTMRESSTSTSTSPSPSTSTSTSASASPSPSPSPSSNPSEIIIVDGNNFVVETNLTIQNNRYDYQSTTTPNYYGEWYQNNISYSFKVNPFWLHFPPPSTRAYHTMAIIYIFMSIIGCFGNAFVIFMFIRFKSLRTPANTLVINLAVSDFLMLAKGPIAIYNNFEEGPALGDLGCRIYGFVGGLTGTTSIITLTAIALDRYNVVVHPLNPIRSSSKLRIRLTLAFIWLYSFCFSVIPALDIGLSVYVPEGYLTTCSFDYLDRTWPARVFMFIFFVGAWCIPFSIILFCYAYILKVVCNAGSIQSSKDKNKTELKLAVIVFIIIGLWFLAWTPYSIVALLGITGNEDKLTPLGSMIPAIFCKSSACIDPYIYAATHPRFRMELRRLLMGRLPIRRSSTIRSTVISRSTTTKRYRRDVISDVQGVNDLEENFRKNNMSIIEERDEFSSRDSKQQYSEVDECRF